MVTAIDERVSVNVPRELAPAASRSLAYPAIELTSVRRKVVLVRLPYEMIYRVYGKLPRNHEVRPPLGLAYVAAALEEAGHSVVIIDAEPEMLCPEEIFLRIRSEAPDIVGFTATTPEIHGVYELSRIIKNWCDEIKIMVGGSHVSSLPRETLDECPEIDYVVVGEGELSAVYLCNHLPDDAVLRSREVTSVDELPVPARHLLDYRCYRYVMPGKGLMPMDAVEAIRGCPFMCTFCSVRGKKPRKRDVKKVVDEIENSHRLHGTKLVMFFDDTLTVVKQYVLDLCDEIIRRGLHKKVVFYANTRANTTTPEVLDKMIEAGLTEISMGVETGSDEMMKTVRKGCQTGQYKQVYRWMYERGLQTRGSFIVGLPHETHESVRTTIDFAKSVDLMRLSVNILTPYPETFTYQQALAGDGLHLLCRDWREFRRYGNAVIRTDDLTAGDLRWYQRRFLTEFYTQPKVLYYHLLQLLRGNVSLYFYRPVLFAIKNRIKDFATRSRPPTWNNYLARARKGISRHKIVSKFDDPLEVVPTGKESHFFANQDLLPAFLGDPHARV